MPIQYGNMNPFQGLPEAVATGMQLRAQKKERQEPEDMINDPGERPKIELRDYTKDVSADIQEISELDKKIKGFSYQQKKEIYAKKASSMKSGVGKAFLESDDWRLIDQKEFGDLSKKINANDPTAKEDLDILSQKLGKNSKTVQAMNQKLTEAQAAVNEKLVGRKEVLWSTIEQIDNVQSGLSTGRIDRVNKKSAYLFSQKPEYLKELTMLDPEGVQEYMGKTGMTKKPGGSGTANPNSERIRYIGVLQKFHEDNKFTSEKLSDEARKMREELMKGTGPVTQSEANKFNKIIQQTQASEKKDEAVRQLPSPKKRGDKMPDEIAKQYLEITNGDIEAAEKLAKKKGWDTD